MAAQTARHEKHDSTLMPGRGLLRAAQLAAVVLSLAGCAMGGFSIDKAVPDTSTITGSVKSAQKTEAVTETNQLSDQSTIKSIVSALDFTQWGKKPVPWANPDTGSQGTITTIAESRAGDVLCRQFQTSREAFDGVSIYRGETCMQRGGNWTLTSFAPI
ncbi:RT0821/Lpp0805 family surface protein [Falsochrobactrum shanghaiense]|nr:RT0821/Lpp0805 family surface protein [Falsochrobactrum shanghaiense]